MHPIVLGIERTIVDDNVKGGVQVHVQVNVNLNVNPTLDVDVLESSCVEK
jgi:hypothetical protein